MRYATILGIVHKTVLPFLLATGFLLAIGFLLATGPGNAETKNAGSAVAAGKRLAELKCARCHVVGDYNRFGGIGSTPSFQLLAKRDDYLERFQSFFARRPHPAFVRMPDVAPPTQLPANAAVLEITPEELETIILFVETLAPES